MKVDKEKLYSDIQDILSDGIINSEEVDVTAHKIMQRIIDLIRIAEMYKPRQK